MNIRLYSLTGAALLMLAACGSKADDPLPGDGSESADQNLDSSGSGNGSSTNPGNSGDPNTPVSSDPSTGAGTSGDDGANGGGTSGQPPVCANGAVSNGPAGTCNATFKGLCFATDADACACAGCSAEQCVVLQSFPTQVGCNVPAPDNPCGAGFERDAPSETRRCDFVAKGYCFEDSAAACACAGCAANRCAILESYPAQARCQ